jgi:hypothetical protein
MSKTVVSDTVVLDAQIMTRERAARLQEHWKKDGDHRCEHEHLKLERTQAGFLTGSYFCLQCGAAVTNFSPRTT